MKINRCLILVTAFAFLCPSTDYAQDKKFAKKIIDTLSSPVFEGRGYVDNGDGRAAEFIAAQFKQAGLKPFAALKDQLSYTNPYFQPFTMPVNTFPGKMEVSVDGLDMAPGKDYLVDPASGGCRKTTLLIVSLDSAQLADIMNGKKIKLPKKRFAFAIPKKVLEPAMDKKEFEKVYALKPAALLSVTEARLIWSVSPVHIDIPLVEIRKDMLNAGAKKITLQIDEKQEMHKTQNVTGYIEGSQYPDSFIFITAHYDHLGEMGKGTYFPGANDNASGTAMLIDFVRYFAKPENRPRYSIGFISFAGEEAGLVGSKYYTQYPVVPLKQIAFLINMDLMANGQDGVMVVNGDVFKGEYNKLVALNDSGHYLKNVAHRGKAANSDHYWFSQNNVKAFFFYLMGAYPYYHDIYDTADKPTLAGYDGAFRLTRDFIASFGK